MYGFLFIYLFIYFYSLYNRNIAYHRYPIKACRFRWSWVIKAGHEGPVCGLINLTMLISFDQMKADAISLASADLLLNLVPECWINGWISRCWKPWPTDDMWINIIPAGSTSPTQSTALRRVNVSW